MKVIKVGKEVKARRQGIGKRRGKRGWAISVNWRETKEEATGP
jgi:hypothetical protein